MKKRFLFTLLMCITFIKYANAADYYFPADLDVTNSHIRFLDGRCRIYMNSDSANDTYYLWTAGLDEQSCNELGTQKPTLKLNELRHIPPYGDSWSITYGGDSSEPVAFWVGENFNLEPDQNAVGNQWNWSGEEIFCVSQDSDPKDPKKCPVSLRTAQ